MFFEVVLSTVITTYSWKNLFCADNWIFLGILARLESLFYSFLHLSSSAAINFCCLKTSFIVIVFILLACCFSEGLLVEISQFSLYEISTKSFFTVYRNIGWQFLPFKTLKSIHCLLLLVLLKIHLLTCHTFEISLSVLG